MVLKVFIGSIQGETVEKGVTKKYSQNMSAQADVLLALISHWWHDTKWELISSSIMEN